MHDITKDGKLKPTKDRINSQSMDSKMIAINALSSNIPPSMYSINAAIIPIEIIEPKYGMKYRPIKMMETAMDGMIILNKCGVRLFINGDKNTSTNPQIPPKSIVLVKYFSRFICKHPTNRMIVSH